ncbi:hypothetical protein [Psychrobacter alimentarius]|uniref:hypothetical protein n=1 Tax=Psychrobacter alimentarius TaxID=261164 RepID=UPI003FD2EE53
MSYIAPDLSIEVELAEMVLAPPDLDVTLRPQTSDILLTADGSILVESNIVLQHAIIENESYVPPSLNDTIVLLQNYLGVETQVRDVILCYPNDNNIKNVLANIDATIDVVSNIAIDVTEFVVGTSIESNVIVRSEIIATYDSNVFRGSQLDVSSNLQYSKIQGVSKQGQFESNRGLTHDVSTDWQQSKSVFTDSQAQFEANIKISTNEQLITQNAKRVSTCSGHDSEYSELIGQSRSLINETAKKASYSNYYSFEAMLKRQTQRKVEGEYSYLDAIMRQTSSDYNRLVGYQYRNLIETAKLPSWFTGYLPPPLWQTVILRQQLSAPALPLDVTLCAPKSQSPRTKLSIAQSFIDVYGYLALTAKENDGTNPQPQTGVIFVTNSVSLVRSDDGREIKLLGFSVGIDSNSYTWSLSATVPLSELSKVNTAHEQQIGVDFMCNGNLWRFILDGCDDSASFGESSLTIKGKSRAMLLAGPYSSQRGFKYDTPMSARQIAEDELNRNGVPSGFTLDWQLAGINGWNVPANTYSYSNKTPINSLQWIAEAAGGFINAHMSEDIIHVLANYPIPSWEWSDQTPLLTLPISLITSRSRGRVNKPAYNGVTLYGENEGGIGALVKRTGTSGGYQPPMITSDLMTDTAAAISRGKMILSDTGDIGNIGISMPLHSDFGVLKPSTLIGVNDGESWIGMVRGTTITGRLSSNQALEIDQSIDVERHFDKESV